MKNESVYRYRHLVFLGIMILTLLVTTVANSGKAYGQYVITLRLEAETPPNEAGYKYCYWARDLYNCFNGNFTFRDLTTYAWGPASMECNNMCLGPWAGQPEQYVPCGVYITNSDYCGDITQF